MLLIVACQGEKDFSLPYEKFVLDNGLQVVLHEDKSDPIVSVAIQYHVGAHVVSALRTFGPKRIL